MADKGAAGESSNAKYDPLYETETMPRYVLADSSGVRTDAGIAAPGSVGRDTKITFGDLKTKTLLFP